MNCHELISDEEIKKIYKDNNLITSTKIKSECKNNTQKNVKINIFKDENNMCQHNDYSPIIREYHQNYKLISPSSSEDNGKVAVHEQFLLKSDFRRKGIAKTIHKKELEVYKRLDFQEIQLEAEMEGLIVWYKLLFKFKDERNIGFIKLAINTYLKTIKKMSNIDIENLIKKDPFKIPIENLMGNSEEENFSNWIYTLYPADIVLIEMYKEIT